MLAASFDNDEQTRGRVGSPPPPSFTSTSLNGAVYSSPGVTEKHASSPVIVRAAESLMIAMPS